MKILIACEYSGTVREAFSKLGHDAWSCDILETEIPGVYAAGDVRVKSLRQVVTATADGAIASVTAEKYIDNL